MTGLKKIPYIRVEDVEPKDKSATKCAPHLEFENGSCIPLDLLIEMAESYNEYYKHNPEKLIKTNSRMETLEPDNYKKYLLLEFKNRLEGDQKDWINSKYFQLMSDKSKDKLEKKIFRPDGPQGRFDWLSTIDINDVLYQYEEKYPDFKFLGAVPLDFIELEYLPFKDFKIEDLQKKGINCLGLIVNTDKSYQKGKHWISLYCDLSKGQIYFSDSMGIRPPKEVNDFMLFIENYLKNKMEKDDVDVRYNKTQHQKGNSECGVYSINFILRLLKGKTFEHITRKRLTDDKVNKCRIKYFSKMNKLKFDNQQ